MLMGEMCVLGGGEEGAGILGWCEIEGTLAGRGGMRVMWGVLRGKTVAGEWYNAAMFDGRER